MKQEFIVCLILAEEESKSWSKEIIKENKKRMIVALRLAVFLVRIVKRKKEIVWAKNEVSCMHYQMKELKKNYKMWRRAVEIN